MGEVSRDESFLRCIVAAVWVFLVFIQMYVFPLIGDTVADTCLCIISHTTFPITGLETKGAAPGVSFGDGDSDGDDDGAAIVSDDSDDFVVLRRDINSGRPVVSGPVHYSVAESVPQPRRGDKADRANIPSRMV